MFPASDKSSDVLKALRRELDSDGVAVRLGTKVTGILISDGRVRGVRTETGTESADAVIVATGGVSYPQTGSTGDGYRFAGWLVNGERREGAALVLCAEDFPDGGCVAETLSEKAEQCLVISEIRTKGKNDWIRLTNAGTGEADLGRFMISDDEEFGSASGLPGLVLKSGESVVLDGKKSTEAGAYRLLFNLSEGEALCLWDRETGECVDRVKVPRMSSVETYGLEPGGCRHVYFLNEGNVRRSR